MSAVKEATSERKATIVESVDISGAVRYIVEVRDQSHRWYVCRRYNDFLAITDRLAANAASLPPVPPKCYWPLGPDAAFLSARQTALQKILDALCSPAFSANADVAAFFAPQRRVQEISEGDSGAPALPVYLPDLPPGTGIAAGRPEAAIRALFVFDQSLNACEGDLLKRAGLFDSQRTRVAAASVELRLLLFEAGRADGARDCVDAVRQAIAFADSFDVEEALTIKRVLGDPGAEVRPLSWYEGKVAEAVAAAGEVNKQTVVGTQHRPQHINELLEKLHTEMENRSRANQASAILKLRSLHRTVEDSYPIAGVHQLKNLTVTPQSALPSLQRRAQELGSAVEQAVATPGFEAGELLGRIEQLLSDAQHCSADMAKQRNPDGGALPANIAVERALELVIAQATEMASRLTGKPASNPPTAASSSSSQAPAANPIEDSNL